jgi:hypothetical protein
MCFVFNVITASATIKWEPMTLESCGFLDYMVSVEWEPMTLDMTVTQQVNAIKC